MPGIPIGGVNERVVVYGAHVIPLYGFGHESQTLQVGAALITLEVRRVYRVSCGCIIDQPRLMGPPCGVCLSVLHDAQAALLNQPPPTTSGGGGEVGVLLDVQLVALATPCVRHYHECSQPFCTQRGGCSLHTALAPDGRYYCAAHFAALARAADVASVEASRGVLAGRLYGVFRSFFAE